MLFSISRRPRNVRDQYRTSPRGILNLRWEEVDLENAVVKMGWGRIGACRKAGLDDVTWRTFPAYLRLGLTRNGADLVTVKELLGHSSVSVTMRYAHTNREAKKRRARKAALTPLQTSQI